MSTNKKQMECFSREIEHHVIQMLQTNELREVARFAMIGLVRALEEYAARKFTRDGEPTQCLDRIIGILHDAKLMLSETHALAEMRKS